MYLAAQGTACQPPGYREGSLCIWLLREPRANSLGIVKDHCVFVWLLREPRAIRLGIVKDHCVEKCDVVTAVCLK